ncbi:VanW family protein [Glutamicibacter nicotianae]|uniref:Vanomycin resistance protein VanB n=1 Tax=Glutamicibacter nicotianae TaxID=37929 RepID=A0ABQ0RGY9_GLUNI|nr:vanomycin resistance protein VanB [Glutamicibacter nicotianae]
MQTPSPDSSSSTPTHSQQDKKKQKGKAKPWIIAGSCVAAVAAAYFGGAAFVSSQVPANASIAGVNIGSMNKDQARAELEREVLPLAQEPVDVTVNGEKYTLDPAKAGLELNVEDTVNELTSYEVNPVKLYERLTGEFHVTPAVDVDEDKLAAQLDALAKKANAEVAEGTIEFEDGTSKLTKPVDGVVLKTEEAADLISDDWEIAGPAIALPADVIKPQISADTLQAFYDKDVKALLKDEVTLASGKKKATISVASIAAAASYAPKDGAPAIALDDKKLYKAATKNSDLSSTAKDAQIVLKDGKPSIIKSSKGISLETKGLGAKVLAATAAKNRTAEVEMTEKEADFTTADAKKLGIKEPIVTFSTPYPASDTVRTKNLRAGSARVNGDIIKPGERFSLLEALGPITVANGYYSSGVVENGFSTEAVGGGLSQISTQMYNVGFLAGYDDITHKPHSRWFERYPAGREATLWEGQIDMIWENNTPYGVMIQAWVSGDKVNTRLWSTKYWDVSQKSSGKYNLTNPETKYNPAEKCVSESGGKKGFSIDITRYRETIDGSKKLPAETKSWTYSPWHKIVCGEKPKD